MDALVDIHTHLIPGIDDGPWNDEEMIALAQQAEDEGITQMILTPHHLSFSYHNPKIKVLQRTWEVQEKLAKAGLSLKVSASQEVHITPSFEQHFRNQEYLTLDEAGKYMLVEFPWGGFPDNGYDVIDLLLEHDITPVIAHPERQWAFTGNQGQKLLTKLVHQGVIAQVTGASLLQPSRGNQQSEALEMIDKGLIHVVASDAHHHVERPVTLNQAYQTIAQSFGSNHVDWLKDNAWRILKGQSIQSLI